MERKLYEASVHGNVASLRELIQEDELILDRVSVTCFDETPLHIAAMRGHLHFARALLSCKPKLATELDYRKFSPLHMASAEGYVDIVKELLSICRDACLFRDQDGRTPLHLAAMKGRVEVLQLLLHVRPEVTRITRDHGETIMHLCVKHNRLEALKVLVESVRDDEFVNWKDDDGNTILHIAAAMKQMETIKFLLTRPGVKVNALNGNSFTALDVIEHCPRDLKAMEIRESFREAGALRAKYLPEGKNGNEIAQVVGPNEVEAPPRPPSPDSSLNKPIKNRNEWFKNSNKALMVAATVIASMAFQAGINPPGGVLDEDIKGRNAQGEEIVVHAGGTSIMAYNYPVAYPKFVGFNTASFVMSSSIILFLLSGLPLNRKIFIWIELAAMWVTLTCMALSYFFATLALAPNHNDITFLAVVGFSIIAWLAVLAIIFLGNTVLFGKWVRGKFWNSGNSGQGND